MKEPSKRLDDQGHGGKEREAFLRDLGNRAQDTWSGNEVSRLFMIALGCNNLIPAGVTRSAETRPSYKGWTFEPINANREVPPERHEMTAFWGKVKDAQGRHISHIGQADAERLLGVQSASARMRQVGQVLHDLAKDGKCGHVVWWESTASMPEGTPIFAGDKATDAVPDRKANR